MVVTDPAGVHRLVFHWPDTTPDEPVRSVRVAVTDDGFRLLSQVDEK